jgi:restriction system protein
MVNRDIVVWGIHAGRTGDAHTLFLKKSVVALGWPKAGDLTQLKDRDEFKEKITAAYPHDKPGSIPVSAGQLFRFIFEMKVGDIIAYPSQRDKLLHIGRIDGDYRYNPSADENYPNQRAVTWLKEIPRTIFSQAALFEIGSAMSFFQIRNYAEEFLAVLENHPISVVPGEEDETVEAVTQDIEQNTRDYIFKRLSQHFKGHGLEHLVGEILRAMGYIAHVTPEGVDGGVDIVAHKGELGIEPPIIKVQVKSGDGKEGDPSVSALYGKLSGANEVGLFISLNGFTPPAKSFAKSKSNLRLIDGDTLIDLILQNYEKFAPRFKAELPLKRVYIPDPQKDDDN